MIIRSRVRTQHTHTDAHTHTHTRERAHIYSLTRIHTYTPHTHHTHTPVRQSSQMYQHVFRLPFFHMVRHVTINQIAALIGRQISLDSCRSLYILRTQLSISNTRYTLKSKLSLWRMRTLRGTVLRTCSVLLRGERGGQILVYNSFRYEKNKTRRTRINWRCVRRDCRANLQTSGFHDGQELHVLNVSIRYLSVFLSLCLSLSLTHSLFLVL